MSTIDIIMYGVFAVWIGIGISWAWAQWKHHTGEDFNWYQKPRSVWRPGRRRKDFNDVHLN
jgi:hypothetical protein